MGKKENPLLTYYNREERFAQLMNGWLFRGKPYLKAEDIGEADRRMEGKSRKSREYRGRYRELFKRLKHVMIRLYIGTELMEYVDYAMPLRIMDSDTLSYLHQKKAVSKRHLEQKDLEKDEYLSRFSKKDKLLPVITLVLYCGEKPWDGAVHLHEMLDLQGVPEELREYVEDYSIHILDIRRTADERLREFPPEVCFLLMCIKYAEDEEALLRLRELSGCSDISEDTMETIKEYLETPEFLEYRDTVEGGKINMASGFRRLLEEKRREGREEGIEWAKQVFKMSREGVPGKQIAEKLDVSEEQVRKILE